jgi:quercetin dioxygenase-like cupin family protein
MQSGASSQANTPGLLRCWGQAPGTGWRVERRAYAPKATVVLPPERKDPELRTHDGYEWLYVLSGRMCLILAEHDITMGAGEVAEFDTRLPHWFGAAGDEPVGSSACSGSKANASTSAPHRAARL